MNAAEIAKILLLEGNPSEEKVDRAQAQLAEVDEVAAYRHAAWYASNRADWIEWLAAGNTPFDVPPENPVTAQLLVAYDARLCLLAGLPIRR